MQKATYFLQELARVPLELEFILYKHGPFSFDLRDELTAMRANGFLRLEPQHPYGPSLLAGERSDLLKNANAALIERHQHAIHFVAGKIGDRTVSALERIATALWVTLNPDPNAPNRASHINQLKPHIGIAEADAAIREVDEIRQDIRMQ